MLIQMKIFRMLCPLLILCALCAGLLAGCNTQDGDANREPPASAADGGAQNAGGANAAETDGAAATALYVRFGDSEAFPMHLYDNATAATLAEFVGMGDLRLPLYHYDDYEHWEVMQYYDIPSQYEIPAAPEAVTEERAGTVYFAAPNRIVLFYGDAEVSGEYTPVGYFDATEDFVSAVVNNPVVEGWSNKLIHISAANE